MIIHLHHLIISKKSAGRLKDKMDVETLMKIQMKKKDSGSTAKT